MAVTSVERQSIDIVATTDETESNVVGSQDLAQCAIFPTHYLDYDAIDGYDGGYTPDVRYDLLTSPDRIRARRAFDVGLHRSGVSLVEFAPGISIQRGTFVMQPADTVGVQAITAVASLNQAFLLQSVRGDNWQHHTTQVRGYFSALDELTFERTTANWFHTIEWTVIEDDGIGDILSVTPFTIVLGTGVLSNTATVDVDRSKSFIACAQMITTNPDASEYGVDVRLTDGTTITADRLATGAVVTVSGFVIELVEAAASVQHGTHSFAGALLSTDTSTVTAVDDGVPWRSNQGYTRTNSGGSGGSGKYRVTLSDPTTVLGEHYHAYGTASVSNHWSLIEFGSVGGGGPPPADESLPVALMGSPF